MTRLMLSRLITAAGAASLATLLLAPTAVHAVPPTFDYQAQLVNRTTGTPITSPDVTVTVEIFANSVITTPDKTLVFPNLNLTNSSGYVNVSIDPTGLSLDNDMYLEVIFNDNTDGLPAERLLPRVKVNSVPFALNSDRFGNKSYFELTNYIDQQALAAEANAKVYADSLFGSIGGGGGPTPDPIVYNRTIFVNPAATPSGTPDGSLANPFADLAAAYAHAKTLPGAGSFFDRIVVRLQPGRYNLTTTLDLDTVGIDLVGDGFKSAFIEGTADPLVRFSAGTSGARIHNLQIRPNGATNVGLEVLAGGLVSRVDFARTGGAPGNLITLNIPDGVGAGTTTFSFREFGIFGGVNVLSYGDQTTFNDGFITGTVTSTGSVGDSGTELIGFFNMSAISNITFNPSGFAGALVMVNIPSVSGLTYDGSKTVIRAGNVSFFNPTTFTPLTLADPLPGSTVVGCIGNVFFWTGATSSTGNVVGEYVAYTRK